MQAFADGAAYNLNKLRVQYLEASKDSEVGKKFNKLMHDYKGQDPVVMAYRAASDATMAKYVWNPYSKLKHLKTSAAGFKEAVAMSPNNAEIRFLRFTVEHYVPRYLDMSGHLDEDKKIIISSLRNHRKAGLDPDFARTMRDFLLTKDHLNEEEKVQLKQVVI
nr:hypothetical protein [Pontibacter harenae]